MDESVDHSQAAEAMMDGLLKDSMTEVANGIDTIVNAVGGKQGHLQSDIPEEMIWGNSKNPAVQVFAGGQWLYSSPGSGIIELFQGVGAKMVS